MGQGSSCGSSSPCCKNRAEDGLLEGDQSDGDGKASQEEAIPASEKNLRAVEKAVEKAGPVKVVKPSGCGTCIPCKRIPNESDASPTVVLPNGATAQLTQFYGFGFDSTPAGLAKEVEAFINETAELARADIPSPPYIGYKDISKPSAKVFFKMKDAPARDVINIRIKTQDQVSKLPLLEMQDDAIRCGAVPTVLANDFWYMWFPFCDSTEILKRFSPDRYIVRIQLKVLFLSVDFIAFVGIRNKLATDGCIEVVMGSPPTGSEGTEWLGITIPPKVGVLPRVCLRHAFSQMWPTSMDNFDIMSQMEIEDVAGAPQWIKVFVFQQIAIRMLPEIVKFQEKIPGSAMDKYLNGKGPGCIEPELLQYIHSLHKDITGFVGNKS